MTSCSACDSGLNPGTSGGGKKRRMNKKSQRGGALHSLSPASLTGDSFDRSGDALANAAHNLYVKQNYELAALKNQNAMMGGSRKKTAKKYRSRSKSKSKSKQQRGGVLELGALVNDAAVPFSLLAAQQKYGKRRGTKARKSRKFRSSRRR